MCVRAQAPYHIFYRKEGDADYVASLVRELEAVNGGNDVNGHDKDHGHLAVILTGNDSPLLTCVMAKWLAFEPVLQSRNYLISALAPHFSLF